MIALPEGKYAAILADPPWLFGTWGLHPSGRSAEKKYGCMTVDEICELPIGDLCADDAVLFLWVCWPHLAQSLSVIGAWGFTYKTEAFSWVKVLPDTPRKPRIGLGYWTRANTDPCLLATRGNPKRLHKDVGQVIAEPIREHSRKPDCVHDRIERLVAGPYLELFGRANRPGWTVWGNEVGKFDEITLDLDL